MGVADERLCKRLHRGRARFLRAVDYIDLQFKLLRDPDTSRQARVSAALQVSLTGAGCAALATFAFLFFYFKWYTVHTEPPPAPTNPRPAIVWATGSYYVSGKPITCLHEGLYLECDIYDYKKSPPGSADAYIFYGTSAHSFPAPRNPKTLWILIHEESPRNNRFFMHEKGLQLFNFTATFSQHSDVPFPLIYLANFDDLLDMRYYKNVTIKNAALQKLAPVLYIQSDCDTSTERDKYVIELMKYISVDSYGVCLNNKVMPLGINFKPTETREYLKHLQHPSILELVSYYKFWISIENAPCPDYMTEKLWRPLKVGVVPIYFGAPNVRDYLPNPKAAILLEDYPTPALMAARLHELNENDQLYEEYLRHKLTRRIDNQRLIDEAELRPYQLHFEAILRRLECMACVRLHENSSRVNMAKKNHYNCPDPYSAITLDKNPDNTWILRSRKSEEDIDRVYKEIAQGVNATQRLVQLWY